MDQAPASWQPRALGVRGRRWFDITVVVVLLVFVPAYAFADQPVTSMVLASAQIVPLLWRRQRPLPVFVAVATASAAQVVLLNDPMHSQFAFPVAVYSVSRFSTSRAGALALTVGLVAATVASFDWLLAYSPTGTVSTGAFTPWFLTIATTVVVSWALGTLGRTRAAYVAALVERGHRIERAASQQVALAASEERARIAREMHDVVAHGLTTIVVQADGASYAAARQPEAAQAALNGIAETGREALLQMRRVLGVLREVETGTAPQPQLTDLTALVDDPQITAQLEGLDNPVGAGVALTTYRITQESLTNVRKHAGPQARARVSVRVDKSIEIVVADDGRGAGAANDGQGSGLAGIRERVAAHGGEFSAGPQPGGGYRVFARLPL